MTSLEKSNKNRRLKLYIFAKNIKKTRQNIALNLQKWIIHT